MALPQLCEVFDRWDAISDFGNDTEFMLIVIGICIGLCLLSALVIAQFVGLVVALVTRIFPATESATLLRSFGTDYLRLLYSPPLSLTSLRI
jgi:hypothetical protein